MNDDQDKIKIAIFPTRLDPDRFLNRYNGPNAETWRENHNVSAETVERVKRRKRIQYIGEMTSIILKPAVLSSLVMLGASFFASPNVAIGSLLLGVSGFAFAAYKALGAGEHYSNLPNNLADFRPAVAKLTTALAFVAAAGMFVTSCNYVLKKAFQDKANAEQHSVLLKNLDSMGTPQDVSLRTLFRVPANQLQPRLLRVDAGRITAAVPTLQA